MFATNLNDADLTDEAFMRRMGYRLAIPRPTWSAYEAIFRRAAADFGLSVQERSMEWLVKRYKDEGRLPNSCEPRDLISRVVELCRFEQQEVTLTDHTLALAWEGYFGTAGETPNQRIFR